jgi:hypothetical protein
VYFGLKRVKKGRKTNVQKKGFPGVNLSIDPLISIKNGKKMTF